MKFNRSQVKKHLQSFDFTTLFIEELGWDYTNIYPVNLTVDTENYKLTGIAQKRGLMVYHCVPENGKLPINKTRRKIDEEMTTYSHEHLIIYTDENQKQQIWQWVRREPGKPVASRENNYYIHQSGESLIQKLEAIYISLEEEENLTLLEVTKKTKKAFDVDKITKKFYDKFKTEYNTFLGFINGIPVKFDHEWYASLMLNRLMFIYFIQRKGFLNNDLDYLRTKLNQCQQINNEQNNTFYSFYRYFLLRLFHDGLGSQNRTPELEALLGKIPYLNGGLFAVHYLEQTYPEITISDAAFTQIFNFFDQYNWHLDERPLKNDNEINPDVLGYIFQKYINQKQMGAYYTKEDITEYISKNCIIPYLFDAVKSENYDIWNLLKDNPERYIYEAVKKGVNLPLPEHIAIGLNDVSQRQNWNLPADENYGLPTEIWREYITRKNRYVEIREKLVNGEIKNINDLITYNLNIRQFAEDVINNCEEPQFLHNIYHQLGKMSILDPTCGSGAFLFAAVNILEPLYDACLEKMTSFTEDNNKEHKKIIQQFQQILNDVKIHHNRRYFILKKIMLNNLYGVDIMEEATEICKLRLFLKLAAQVTPNHSLPNYGIEPLPDIDFNIRAGNSLVGFANYDEVKKAVEGSQQLKLDLFSDMTRIDEKAKRVSEVYQTFRNIQTTTVHGSDFSATKELLQESLNSLNEELNEYLVREYGIDVKKKKELEKWKLSHRPFHWFVEFYDIINHGGFDVIIGNPPYVEYSKVKKDYEIKGYQTEKCGNLYGLTIERSGNIAINKSYMGMILQLPIVCTDRMISLQDYLIKYSDYLYCANFDDRPGKLFDGLEHIRATIVICQQNINHQDKKVYSTNYIRWYSETRNTLFNNITYQNITNYLLKGSIPKINDNLGLSIFHKISNYQKISLNFVKNSDYVIYYHSAPQYWIRVINFIPYFWNEKEGNKISSHIKLVYLKTELDSLTVIAILNSSLFYWWFIILSDCRHLNMREIENFTVGLDKMSTDIKNQLITLTDKLMKDFQKNSFRKEASYKTTGKVIYDEYYPKLSKPIIDEIDKILAEHYEFTEEELDFIINYDIKYRMGKELAEDDN